MTGRQGNMKIFFQNPIALCGIIANFALSHIYTVEQRNSYQWQRSLIYIYINIVSPCRQWSEHDGRSIFNPLKIIFIMKNNEAMNFKVRAYGRTELAQMYCPNLQPESAFRKLCRWISLEPELSRRLLKNGKMPPVRSFTPAEVKLIVERLGEP